MAELTDAASLSGRYLDPFGGGSRIIAWPCDLNVAQLHAELTALDPELQFVAYLPQDDATGAAVPADSDHPYIIYLQASTADVAAVMEVLEAHSPDPVSDEEELRQQILSKIRAREDLSEAEMQEAFRILLG